MANMPFTVSRRMLASLLGAALIAAPCPGRAAEAHNADADWVAATRGKIAKIPDGRIVAPDGHVVWDAARHDFLDGPAPPTVNPALWRQAQLNHVHGLFEIVPGLWQVRGYDLAVMTVIRGRSGWIVIDPLLTEESARAAFALVQQTLGRRPISAVIFTHSHADHFGGVLGVLSAEDAAQRRVPIIAPHGFAEAAVSENVLAGNAMTRRAGYMFGTLLAPGPEGQIDTGLGIGLAIGTTGYLAPTETIGPEGGRRVIDGVTFEFMDAAGTEAPAEFLFYLPNFKVLHTSEVAVKTLHNVLTMRGAQVRDALHWSKVIDAALMRWGDQAEIQVGSHNWPSWGGDAVRGFLTHQRDAYRYIHDRTLGRANNGMTLHEVAADINAPRAQSDPDSGDHYGTINHNMKATYQRYFGWWDGVPAHLNPPTPEAEAKGYVALAGGPEKLLAAGLAAHDAGDDRWAAVLLNHLVFADPANPAARDALARVYEALGFAAEAGTWRNYYLAAAATLRGTGRPQLLRAGQSLSFLAAIPTEALFDALATRFDAVRADGLVARINFVLPDTDEAVGILVQGDVEIPRYGAPLADPEATIRMRRADLDRVAAGETDIAALARDGAVTIEGDAPLVLRWLGLHPPFDPGFAVVTP